MDEESFGKLDEDTVREIFNKFSGQEIDVHLQDKSMETRSGTHWYKEPSLPDDEPTIKKIADLAQEHGLRLRVWLEGSGGTFGEEDRLNVFIKEDEHGKFRVTNTFFIG